jgi:hypothetical protein
MSGQHWVIAMRRRLISVVTTVALLLAAKPMLADDLAGFNAAIEDVAAHNRAALGYLHNQNADLAAVELEQMRDAWGAFAERFGRGRPERFRDNALYVTMLADVPTRIVAATIMINFGRPDVAAGSLQAIRQELSAVRRGSGVELLADRVLGANAAMEALLVYQEAPPDWNRPAAVTDFAQKAAAYGTAVARCDAMAPAALSQSGEFRRLVDGIAAALAFVPKAIEARDNDLIHRVIIELRSFDNLLAFRYG